MRYGITFAVLLMIYSDADAQVGYQKAPKAVQEILDAPLSPSLSVNPTRDTIALIWNSRYPGIADLAEPMQRLAGLRINPQTNGPAQAPRMIALSVQSLNGGEAKPVKLPPGKATAPDWSLDGKQFALTVTNPDGITLYAGFAANGTVAQLGPPEMRLNAALGDPVQWLNANELLVMCIPANRGKMPVPPAAPLGPTVQECTGKAAPVRTFQDLLKDSHDEDLFEYLTTSQLAIVRQEFSAGGPLVKLGEPGIYTSAVPSPDGQFLLVTRIKRPFSYLFTSGSFPRSVEVWDRSGKVVHVVADLPLQDKVPIDGVPTGPRAIRWVPNEKATLTWVEALDEGDPKKKVPHRDAVFTQAAPFTAKPAELLRTEHRFGGISYFEKRPQMLVTDFDRDRKWTRTRLVSPGSAESKTVFDRSIQDRYGDPGDPLFKPLPTGRTVLRELEANSPDSIRLLLNSGGATPKGDMPFLASFDVQSGKSEKLFQCRDGMFESVVSVLSDDAKRLIIRRESPTEPANYYLRDGDKETRLTHTTDPFPELRKVKKQLVSTKRPDGVTLTFTLYTPPNYKDGDKLPTVFWAYPQEFNTADTAGQVRGSPHRFDTIAGTSHLFFLLQGYAIMDDVSMPVVGPVESANDTFVEQIVTNAKTAIDKAVELGAVDRERIGVGGHSYGAFMTANLLAHSNLFRAGIARSGAYNRTLTPFGFQSERRTFWEAPAIYSAMSPFHHANKIDEPLLMIHGAADNNPGTFPIQSERLYQAIRGNGGTARLVLLPHESHGYSARESIEHVLAEQFAWFDKHVKNAKPRGAK